MPVPVSGILPVIVLLLAAIAAPSPAVTVIGQQGEYDLAVSFSPASHALTGTARITLPPGSGLGLDLGGLSISGLLLRHGDGRETSPVAGNGRIDLPAEPDMREMFVSYSMQATGAGDDVIDSDGIVLLGRWHPVPDRRMRFSLQARLPPGFVAISESDRFPLAVDGDTASASFSQPLQTLHFAAAPYAIDSLEVRPGLQVHTLFFPGERQLAASYLESAAGYLRRFERDIGPYPYNHYVVAANRRPTGLGLPTFTLLGQQVLRLPFIRETSLGHEVLHSWFGNSVEIDPTQGNWGEGLTTFLADHAFRSDHGEGAADRKERIVNYLSYAGGESAIPLSAFRSADHRQPQAEAVRAVGYNRAAMLFAELQAMLGNETFFRGIRQFYGRHRGQSASWNDLRLAFDQASSQDLAPFFADRLLRQDIPRLSVEDVDVRQTESGSRITFQLVQETERPFSLQVPVAVTTSGGAGSFIISSAAGRTPVSLTTDGLPLQLSIDPEYTFLRRLDPAELPPVWSQYLGAAKKLAVIESAEMKTTYQPLLDLLADDSWTVKLADEVRAGELAESAVLFLGLDHPVSRSLFARPASPATGFSLEVRRHPLNPGQPAVLVASTSREETAAAAAKLRHYGKYSRLHFERGRNVQQQIAETESGINLSLDRLPNGVVAAALQPFAGLVAGLADTRVVFIGETHTSMADHRLQLQLIEALHRQNPDLAIGMEMFPASSQAALDAWSSGDPAMDERDFLKASRYFQVWSQDYRYYRDIITFVRSRKIPLVGLNIDQEVTRTVFRTGSTEALPEVARKALPVDRDLSLPGYTDNLAAVHGMHQSGGHGNGPLAGFIQAQALWDEAMAENIAGYLKRHPDRRMVVLAGNQHARKDTGIPPRLARRLQLSQATVTSIQADGSAADLAATADFVFSPEFYQLPPQGMMGIVLESRQENGSSSLQVSDFTPQSLADDAGLRPDDILVAINGAPVPEMDDVRIALLDTRPGDRITAEIDRRRKDGTRQRHRLTIELIAPARHP
ncbi:MAG: PDZ domain-containing protein [Desulfobulbaceae bacterium]|nr:MAG: PDZ domain-containing protein [Desulfobulbaceae bacterium]